MQYRLLVIIACAVPFLRPPAIAVGLTDADKCEAAKLKVAGKYGFCRLKAAAKAVKVGGSPDYGQCDAKYLEKWTLAETDGAGQCPTDGDATAVQSFVVLHTADLSSALGGGPLPDCPGDLSTCTSDLMTCDADLAACQAQTAPVVLRTGQLVCYDGGGSPIPCAGTGQDGDLQKGAVLNYVDNGDGTITDTWTKLTWEKLSLDGSVHDANAGYVWGTAFNKISALNAAGFAGHSDWRLPNINELRSLLLDQVLSSSPVIYDPIFNTGCNTGCSVTTCSCTQYLYWSSTSYAPSPSNSWIVDFLAGIATPRFKGNSATYVRAVRGGS